MAWAILTDIEGTTSSLSFVQDVLFPYARERLAEFVQTRKDDALVLRILADARAEAGIELDEAGLIAQLTAWIDADQKINPLKELQGLIWEDGYKRGDFTGHVYRDAWYRLQAWKRQGLDLYVYSSGSVHAQRLLFEHTDYGDLRPLFSGYFDTTIGHKREADSYRIIAHTLRMTPKDILFLSDVVEELDAARIAGLHTCQLVRGGDLDATAAHPQARGFDMIKLPWSLSGTA
ncbi:MAG: acireductone synthase [Gammaproteobacteria bacterium]|nr:acireductone synthase [Gammaproteobacteria bacterium]MCP5423852.1 acireductone synthase [Gammaproteobacteria bacterium]